MASGPGMRRFCIGVRRLRGNDREGNGWESQLECKLPTLPAKRAGKDGAPSVSGHTFSTDMSYAGWVAK